MSNDANELPMVDTLNDVDPVATRLGVSTKTVRRLLTSGALPCHRIGRLVRISNHDLAEYLARTRHADTPQEKNKYR